MDRETLWSLLFVAALASCSDATETRDAAPAPADTNTAEAGMDLGPKADQMRPDQALPDLALPDLAQPDQMQPDTAPPAPPLWTVSAGGYGWDTAYSVAVDSTGDTYITGRFEGTAYFGSTALTSKGEGDIYVARLDKNGKFTWAVAAGGTSEDYGASIAVDGSGNTTITGGFKGTVKFGGTTLTAKGGFDVFVVRLDKNGKFAWAVAAGGLSDEGGSSLALDSAGNITLTGGFKGKAKFGGSTLIAQGGSALFVARLDKSGTFTWAVAGSGLGYKYGSAVALDGSGNATITGLFMGTAKFAKTTLTAKGGPDIFVARMDKGGKFVWAAAAGGTSSEYAYDIAVDGSGNTHITGSFHGSAMFGSTALATQYGDDIFVAKLDKNGKFTWAVAAGGTTYDTGASLALDGSGNILVTGTFTGTAMFAKTILVAQYGDDIFVAKLDKNGKFTWAVTVGGKWHDYSNSIAVDSSGGATITGRFEGTAMFAKKTLATQGKSDIFVARLDKNGNF